MDQMPRRANTFSVDLNDEDFNQYLRQAGVTDPYLLDGDLLTDLASEFAWTLYAQGGNNQRMGGGGGAGGIPRQHPQNGMNGHSNPPPPWANMMTDAQSLDPSKRSSSTLSNDPPSSGMFCGVPPPSMRNANGGADVPFALLTGNAFAGDDTCLGFTPTTKRQKSCSPDDMRNRVL